MGKTCFILKCLSGHRPCKEKVSLFQAPKNEQLFNKWKEAVAIHGTPRTFTKNHYVCEKHFKTSDITKTWVSIDNVKKNVAITVSNVELVRNS